LQYVTLSSDAKNVVRTRQLKELKVLVPPFYGGLLVCSLFVSGLFFERLPVFILISETILCLVLIIRISKWLKLDPIQLEQESKKSLLRNVEIIGFFLGLSTTITLFAMHSVATPLEQIALLFWAGFCGIGGGVSTAVVRRASISVVLLSIIPYAMLLIFTGGPLETLMAAIFICSVPIGIIQYGRIAETLINTSLLQHYAEIDQAASEKTLRSFMAMASDWVWATDTSGTITYFSKAGTDFLAMRAEDIIGEHLIDIVKLSVSESDYTEIEPIMIAMRNHSSAREVQFHATNGKGERRLLQSTIVTELNSDQSLKGFSGWTTDITEKVENQLALEASEQRFRDFANSAADWVWEADENLQYTFISDRAEQETGFDHSSFIGTKMGIGIADNSHVEIEKHNQILENRLEFKNLVNAIHRDNEETIWISRSGRPVFDSDGSFKGYRGTCRNVTSEIEGKNAIKRSEKLLAESNKHLQKEVEKQTDILKQRTALLDEIIGTMTQGLVVYDEEFKILVSNEKAVTLSGVSSELWKPGKKVTSLIEIGIKAGVYPYSDLDEYLSTMNIALDENGVFEVIRNQTDNRIINESVQRAAFGGHVVTYTDVTAQKNREQELVELSNELEESRDAAEEANRTKSSFLANMSHEIRTPMNGVIGMASLLVDSQLEDKQKEMAEVIVNSGENLLTIINDILDFSRLEAGKLSIKPEPFSLRSVVEDVAALLRVKIQEKGLEFLVRYDPTLEDNFIGDEARIRQIITNLVGNAVKFTEEGHIFISVSGQNHGETCEINVSVEDTGCGIPTEKLGSIFEEFEQVDGTSARKHDGTGLGLAITSRLTNAMGGTIDVSSTINCGSTFVAKLPLVIDEEASSKSEPLVALRSGMRALIVDDNSVNRTILLEQLKAWGVVGVEAINGPAALAAIDENTTANEAFDFAIIDYQMPEMDGEELAIKIREIDGLFSLPIIILTSAGKKGDPEGRKNGLFDAYLVKPARSSMLFNAITSSIQQRSITTLKEAVVTEYNNPTADSQETVLNILIAEDNIINQMVIKSMLEKLQCHINLANNGRQAVEKYTASVPDIVLMDISMPEMDGIEATAKIRKIQEASNRHIPIIGVTAHALKEDRQRCLDAGMDDYLSKPVKIEPLSTILKKWTAFTPQKSTSKTA